MIIDRSIILTGLFLVLISPASIFTFSAFAQDGVYDDTWYTSQSSFVKIAVTQDGVYKVTGAELAQAGLSLASVNPNKIRLIKNGAEVPIWIEGETPSSLAESDAIVFVGEQNRGDEELWAFEEIAQRQGSDYFSLFSDTTWYWLGWQDVQGETPLRYTDTDPLQTIPGLQTITATNEVDHLEEDVAYYFGDSNDAAQPQYTRGEGFVWLSFTHIDSNPIDRVIPVTLDNLSPEADSVHIEVKLSSASGTQHLVELRIEANGSPIACDQCTDSEGWNGYSFRSLTVSIPTSLIRAAMTLNAVVTSSNDFNSTANRILIDWLEASYSRSLNIDKPQRTFTSVAGAQSLQLTQSVSQETVVFNPVDNRRFFLGNAASFTLNDNPSDQTTYWVSSNTSYLSSHTILTHTVQDLSAETEIVDYLIITTPALLESAQALADYRSQQDGYTTRIVFQNDIFDQFDYGRPTPLAIRRYVHSTLRWNTPPRFLMLWGDALRPETNQPRRPLRAWELISFGYAPSDPWYTMQLNGLGDWTQRMAIGRIPIRDNEAGNFFLTKLSNYESSEPADWQKRFMLLVGGRDTIEQARLQQPAILWSDHASTTPTNMDTLWFFKKASDPLDPSFRDSLNTTFRKGAAWVSYFGHSAADTWEIVTDAPEDYDNADRLPVVISMGCNTGNFAGGPTELADRQVYGERLVLASLNGSIVHWGSSSASTIDQPAALANEVHRSVFQDTTRIMGLAFQKGKMAYLAGASQTKSTYTTLLQYALIGDPATRIQIPAAPELQTSPDAITILPVTPVPSNEKLETNVIVRNWGLTPSDSVQVQLTHNRPTQPARTLVKNVLPNALETLVSFDVPITTDDVGENRIQVVVDPANEFEEVNELNNSAEKTRTVFSTGLAAIAPLDYAIVPTLQPLLRTSLATSDTTSRSVRFELDTVPSFDSPNLQTFSTTTNGLVADWQLSSPLANQTSYYWRARIEDPVMPSPWTEARFTIEEAATSPGWRQSGPQFTDTETNPFLSWNEETQSWEFSEFRVDVRYSSERGNGFEKGQFVVNGTLFENVTLGYGVLVINGTNGEVRDHNSFPTYQIREEFEIRFDTDSTRAMAGLDSLLTNLTPGDYVFVRTRHLGNMSGPVIQDEVKTLFRNLGSTAIDDISYNDLWLMVTRAGFPEETVEWVEPEGPSFTNEVVRDTSLFFMQSEGFTLSPPIGPARSWNSFIAASDLANAQSAVQVEVVDPNNQEVLIPGGPAGSIIDLSSISPTLYPYIRLKATLADSSQQSTPQLTSWEVAFDPTAELGIIPGDTRFLIDSVQISEPVVISTTIQNLSMAPSALPTLTYTLTDAFNQEQVVGTDTLSILEGGQSSTTEFSVSTESMSGANRLRIQLDQPGFEEPFTLNNLLIKEFFVQNDADKPQLEVLIDNEMLPANPEPVRNLQDPALPFVNAQPTIEIILSDSNPFQLLTDSSLFQIEFDREPISFSNPAIQFQPATEGSNEARVFFTPDLSGRDTTHTLFMRVFDVAGNEAEGSPYQVHFRVQADFEIESLYPYPNPMHAFTTFAFRLRGADALLAEEFRIRIYTVAGRLIQEFDLIDNPELLEIPGLRIGWNKLQWDGRDADGDQVAPGVYLYKVFLRSEGEEISVNNSSSIEKLVVLR